METPSALIAFSTRIGRIKCFQHYWSRVANLPTEATTATTEYKPYSLKYETEISFKFRPKRITLAKYWNAPTFPFHSNTYAFLKTAITTSTPEIFVNHTFFVETTSELLISEYCSSKKPLKGYSQWSKLQAERLKTTRKLSLSSSNSTIFKSAYNFKTRLANMAEKNRNSCLTPIAWHNSVMRPCRFITTDSARLAQRVHCKFSIPKHVLDPKSTKFHSVDKIWKNKIMRNKKFSGANRLCKPINYH